MVESFPVGILMGMILGFLAGIGIGGGSLLMLWLTLIVGMEPFTARCVNLMFFIPTALCASLFRWKQGTLDIKKLALPILLGSAAAGLFSWISGSIDTGILRKVFGILLLLTGARELCYRPKRLKGVSEN